MIFKDRDTIYNEIHQDFLALDLNSISPISPAEQMARNYSDNVSDIYARVSAMEESLNPSKYASDKLTIEGAIYGIRRESVIPIEDNTFSNFYFKLQNNTVAGDITLNKSKGFTIPAGTVITGANGEVLYSRDDALFDPEDNKVYVRIYSLSDTITTSISTGTLTSHDVSLELILNVDPDLVQNITLECNNERDLVSESTSLTDEEIKALLQFEYTGLNQINENKVLSAVLRVAGVSDARVVENYNGIGSVGVVVVPVNPLASEGLYGSIQQELISNVIGGDSIEVIRPEYLSLEISCSVELTDVVENSETFYNELRFFIGGLINAIPQGSSFDPQQIETLVGETYDGRVTTFQITCASINGNRCLLQEQIALEDQKYIIYDPTAAITVN